MSSPDPVPENPAVARAEFRLGSLERLSEIGMELAESLRLAPGAVEDFDQTVRRVDAFATASRFVRLTISLETKTDLLLGDLKARIERDRLDYAINSARVATHLGPAKSKHEAHQDRAHDMVFKVIESEAETEEEFCELIDALDERFEFDGAYQACGDRPLRETVERLCKDLGMNPDMSRWDEASQGWANDGPPKRPAFSHFHNPSRRCLVDDFGEPLEPPDAPQLPNPHALE